MTTPDIRREAAERGERMQQACRVCRQWDDGDISTSQAMTQLREALEGEPWIVRVGTPHQPELRTARTPQQRAHRDFRKGASDDATPF